MYALNLANENTIFPAPMDKGPCSPVSEVGGGNCQVQLQASAQEEQQHSPLHLALTSLPLGPRLLEQSDAPTPHNWLTCNSTYNHLLSWTLVVQSSVEKGALVWLLVH